MPTSLSPSTYDATTEATAQAIEAERQRLAQLLQEQLAAPLNLLLAQANAYEQTLGAHPTARMAVSVLATLARQLLQQLRDLEAELHPSVLESLGLAPALETLAGQWMRTHGVSITLTLERLPQPISSVMALALFRLAQDALKRAIQLAHASRIHMRLEQRDAHVRFVIGDNGFAEADTTFLQASAQRLAQLGGVMALQQRAEGFEASVRFALTPLPMMTEREQAVLHLLVEGLSNKQIAKQLSVAPRTVNFHLDNIYSKLGVSSRTEAAIIALRMGLAQKD